MWVDGIPPMWLAQGVRFWQGIQLHGAPVWVPKQWETSFDPDLPPAWISTAFLVELLPPVAGVRVNVDVISRVTVVLDLFHASHGAAHWRPLEYVALLVAPSGS